MSCRAYLPLILALLAGIAVAVRHETAPAIRPAPAVDRAVEPRQPDSRQVAGLAVPPPAASALPGALFAYVRPANAAALDAALPAPSQEIHYVRLNRALFAGKQSPFWQKPGAGRVMVPLPDGDALAITIDESQMLGPDRFVSRGRIEGRPGSRALFAVTGGFLHASIEDPGARSFAVGAATEDLAQFFAVDPARLLRCGGERIPPRASAPALPPRGAGPETPGDSTATPPGVGAAERPAGPEVHVLMAYTQDTLPTLTGAARTEAIQSAFDLAIQKANVAYDTSRITARLKLVGITEVQYDETKSDPTMVQDEALTALFKTNDGKMDEIHAIRDRTGADVVCLALNRPDAVSSGLAFLLTEGGDLGNPLFAFAVVQYSQVATSMVVAHELGHLFGCAHERLDYYGDPPRPPNPGRFPYSYGYRFRDSKGNLYRDIMAYPPGTELPYFSNPRMNAPSPAPPGLPGGVAAGLAGETDTSRTIEEGAFEVAGYRLQTQSAANAGTLINVATRAWVGRDDQVLIGGFVVEGTQPKRMLIRGAGPALAAFGVPDALVDPVLRVVPAGGGTGWQNDNWSIQTDAAEIGVSASQVGAFAFSPGSRDAALLLTLRPGAYTAVLEGVAGATGAGMIEAYEVDRASRIVNLATRGYVDNAGREMVAGFVVQGAAENTKRILIRVLGPTLGRAPYQLTGVLFDPCLELRGADGRLLLENDDWSSGAREVDGDRDDFRPDVKQYNEQHIAATGLAPSNRREPCVMLDLLPGSYTVVVKPFEHRDLNPALDQPAAPGVGILEVYEINQ